MKAHLNDTHLLVLRSRSSSRVKIKYQGHISQNNGHFGGISASQTHLVFPKSRTANLCAVLVGAGGSVPFAGPPLLSSIWFPPDQRATATAGISFANYFGVAMAFIIGRNDFL